MLFRSGRMPAPSAGQAQKHQQRAVEPQQIVIGQATDAVTESAFGHGRHLVHHQAAGDSEAVVCSPPSSEYGMFDGAIPFITLGDLGSGTQAKRTLSQAGVLKSRTVKTGSALVCCIGATIGKMDIAIQESAFNQQINAVEWGAQVLGAFEIGRAHV